MVTRSTALTAAGAALAGAAVVGVPALVVAATDDDERRGPGWFGGDEDGEGLAFGMMQGRYGAMRDRFGGMMGGPGGGMMGGPFGWVDGEPDGKLSDARADDLAVAAERQKLARDLYTAFADSTGDLRFRHLAQAESHHLRALQAMLDVYEVTDPTASNGPGEFADADVADDYAAMLADGSGSEDAAREVARELEESLADSLDAAAEEVEESAPDVSRVYEFLAFASERHADLLEEWGPAPD